MMERLATGDASLLRAAAAGNTRAFEAFVSERLFAFEQPRGTGPVELRQLAADGSTVARETLRR